MVVVFIFVLSSFFLFFCSCFFSPFVAFYGLSFFAVVSAVGSVFWFFFVLPCESLWGHIISPRCISSFCGCIFSLYFLVSLCDPSP